MSRVVEVKQLRVWCSDPHGILKLFFYTPMQWLDADLTALDVMGGALTGFLTRISSALNSASARE